MGSGVSEKYRKMIKQFYYKLFGLTMKVKWGNHKICKQCNFDAQLPCKNLFINYFLKRYKLISVYYQAIYHNVSIRQQRDYRGYYVQNVCGGETAKKT